MTDTSTHVYREVDGDSLELEVVRPATASEATSCVVFFHGGAWRIGDRAQFLPQCNALAERGATAVTVTYRLATEASGRSPAECSVDAAHAVAWVREHAEELGIDAGKIVASGGSAGGQMAAAVAAMGHELAALVLFNPALCPEGTPQLRFMGDACPEWSVDERFPPTLVLHGTADDLVSIDHSRRFAARMHEAGSQCELIEYEGMPHAFFNHPAPEGRYEETLAAMLRFLESLDLL
jgi:acetyl esterase/lipase